MIVLGINGGLLLPYADGIFSRFEQHDSSATLLVNGKIVAAIEEERLNRIKHTNKAPYYAIRYVLEKAGLTAADVDFFAVCGLEENSNQLLSQLEGIERRTISEWVKHVVGQATGIEISEEKIAYVGHHIAHAASAYYLSGFDRALILTIDGAGDFVSTGVYIGENNVMTPLSCLPYDASLGMFYVSVIKYLGYEMFDEYKVMGLAPYGDAAVVRPVFDCLYKLLPDGGYSLSIKDAERIREFLPVRKKGEPFSQLHKDIAAGLQEVIENILLHMLKHYREKYKIDRLCMAGGVAQNCSANGKILYSGLFGEVFVQPASHDSGGSLGAALDVYYRHQPEAKNERLDHVYQGTDISDNDTIERILSDWDRFVSYQYVSNIEEVTAALLAKGEVIGWVQGRAEFGPRSLGNRSIVADPRPAEHKELINSMVKKRESYRPFAPSVMEEYLGEYFELPEEKMKLPFMKFVVKVQRDKQQQLQAVTHIDGTARVQSVSKETNQRYWSLIDEFRKLTGVPVVLNTSFNNNAEPIVNTETDAIVCYLTTKLDKLVIGNYLVSKKDVTMSDYLALVPAVPLHGTLSQECRHISMNESRRESRIGFNYSDAFSVPVTNEMYSVLSGADGKRTLGELIASCGVGEHETALADEAFRLWAERKIILKPSTAVR